MKVKVSEIHNNPFRDLKRLPLQPEKVRSLVASIKETTFWDNLLARNVGDEIQIAYGHHRIAALKKVGVEEIDLAIRKLSDTDMLKIMALENADEWRYDARADIEVVRTVLEAYVIGQIELVKPNSRGHGIGDATDLTMVRSASEKPYSIETIQEFLGNNWGEFKVQTALTALKAERDGVVPSEDIAGLSTREVKEVIQQARRAEKEKPGTGRKVSQVLSDGFRDKDITRHGAKAATDEVIGKYKTGSKAKSKKLPELNEFAAEMLSACDDILKERRSERKRWQQLVDFRENIRPTTRDRLIKALRELSRMYATYADGLESSKVIDVQLRRLAHM